MTQPKEAIVYRVTNRVNGKRYIGVTHCDFARRKREHFHRAFASNRTRTKFSNAILKYGRDAFDFEIISTWETRDLALKEEVRLIAEESPEYNLTSGGDGVPIKDRSQHPDWYKKVSAALKGRKPSALAIQRTKETAWARASKTVVCLNDGHFGKLIDAAQQYGIPTDGIRSVCSGKWFAVLGLFFVESDVPIPAEECLRRLELKVQQRQQKIDAKNHGKRRAIIRLADGEQYESVRVAAAANDISPMRVVQICQRGGATARGLRFAYVEAA